MVSITNKLRATHTHTPFKGNTCVNTFQRPADPQNGSISSWLSIWTFIVPFHWTFHLVFSLALLLDFPFGLFIELSIWNFHWTFHLDFSLDFPFGLFNWIFSLLVLGYLTALQRSRQEEIEIDIWCHLLDYTQRWY